MSPIPILFVASLGAFHKKTCVQRSFGDRAVESGAMKALQATCIVGAITFTGMIHQVGGNTPGATVPDAMTETAVNADTPGAPALSAAVPDASPGPGTELGAELGSVPAAVSAPSLMAKAEIGDASIETK